MQKLWTKLAIFSLLVLIIGCSKDKNPVATGTPDGLSAVGCVIKQGDTDLVRAEKAEINGEFTIEERVQSAMLSFYLVDSKGTLFQPKDEKFILAWDVKNHMVADFIQYETDGTWNFRLKGFEVGATSVSFKIMNDEFESLDIPIRVAASSGGGLNK